MDPYEPNPHLTAWEPPTDPDPDPLPTTSDLGASMLRQTYRDLREAVTAFALAVRWLRDKGHIEALTHEHLSAQADDLDTTLNVLLCDRCEQAIAVEMLPIHNALPERVCGECLGQERAR